MAWCLAKETAEELHRLVKSGELSFSKLRSMSSQQREEAFRFLGKDAKRVNKEFEKKILNKDVYRGLETWLEKTTGINSPKKERLRKMIQRRKEKQNERVFNPTTDGLFLQELASAKVGIGISSDEAKMIFNLSKRVREGNELFDKKTIKSRLEQINQGDLSKEQSSALNSFLGRLEEASFNKKLTTDFSRKAKADITRYLGETASPEQKAQIDDLIEKIIKERKDGDYGVARIELQNFIDGIKLENGKKLWASGEDEFGGFVSAQNYGRIAVEIAGAQKSVVASIDNSFPGRQGWYALTSGNVVEWGNSVKNSFRLIKDVLSLPSEKTVNGNTIKISEDKTIIDGVKASVYNRELGRSGVYDKMKLDVGIREEAFPSSLPEKIPAIGRLFKASNEAYTGTAYLLRADLADKYYSLFKKAKGAELDDVELESIGRIVNSMTGRGNKGLGKLGETTNVFFFSPKFIQSHIDKIYQPFDASLAPQARALATKNLATSAVATGLLLYGSTEMLKTLGVDASFTTDPKSSSFGKIKIGDYRTDVTGGLGGYITIMSRTIALTTGGKYKNEISGVESDASDPVEGLTRFFMNKTSPFARTLLDIATGSDFKGRDVSLQAIKEDPVGTAVIIGKNNIPISLQNLEEQITDDTEGVVLSALLADGLGFSTTKYTYMARWEGSTSKELEAFKEQVGIKTFREAEKEFATIMHENLRSLDKTGDAPNFRVRKDYRNLSNDDKKRVVSAVDRKVKKNVLEKYGYEVKDEELEELSNIIGDFRK